MPPLEKGMFQLSCLDIISWPIKQIGINCQDILSFPHRHALSKIDKNVKRLATAFKREGRQQIKTKQHFGWFYANFRDWDWFLNNWAGSFLGSSGRNFELFFSGGFWAAQKTPCCGGLFLVIIFLLFIFLHLLTYVEE